MSEKKIAVPDGMLDYVCIEVGVYMNTATILRKQLEAALRWLSNNPVLPTREQQIEILRKLEPSASSCTATIAELIAEWQRRMFLAEPDPDESIKDLLSTDWQVMHRELFKEIVREGYARGLKDGAK